MAYHCVRREEGHGAKEEKKLVQRFERFENDALRKITDEDSLGEARSVESIGYR